jgi:hypothetical protein
MKQSGGESMRKLVVTLFAIAALVLASGLAFKAEAQTSRGALALPAQAKNFTPIEKAACGPFVGRWCGPFHRRVCAYGRCWCAHC